MLVFPELHLYHSILEALALNHASLREAAISLEDPLVRWFGELAAEHNIWLIPGSICEKGPNNETYNTALVFNPQGQLVTSYRKMFPWRPFEPYTPGEEFCVFEVPDVGRFGLNICYDAWFPEVSRSLAWMGAELIINIVKTTTPDRAQELVLARANSIVNQVFVVSVNTAGPVGYGQSIITGPEGEVLAEAPSSDEMVLVCDFTRSAVARVRTVGTAGTNRMWDQFQPDDKKISLPIYNGYINPHNWNPAQR
jgi:predicted amidohydrolase